MNRATDILETIATRKSTGEPFALATVVRTVATTSAKAGAKAVILPDGTFSEGWIGGGCARAAVLRRRRTHLPTASRALSRWLEEVLTGQGRTAGEEEGGVPFAKNMCPSQGAMDIFVEPVLPRPDVEICGSNPVAVAVADLAKRCGFAVTVCAPAAEQSAFAEADRRIEGFALPVTEPASRYVIVATQGRGDEAALAAVLAVDVDYVAFVGSRKKAQALRAALTERGVTAERLYKLKAPAGLDLGAITPDEIAISILAEIVAVRRGKSRGADARF